MNRKLVVSIQSLSCFLVALSCILPWTTNPKYTLYTIADYAAVYGRHNSEIKTLSFFAFGLPILSFMLLITISMRRIATVMSALLSIYIMIFMIFVLNYSWLFPNSANSPLGVPGKYLSILAALMLAISVWLDKTSIIGIFRRTNDESIRSK